MNEVSDYFKAMPAKFWMVLRDQSTYVSKRHYDKQSAIEESQRLACKQPDSTFYVLECVLETSATFDITTMPTFELPPEEEVPF